MNTISMLIIPLCLSATGMCTSFHASSQYAASRLGYGGGGDSNSLGGGSGSSDGAFGGAFGGSDEDESADQHHGHHVEHHHEEHHEPKPYGFGYAVKDFKKGTSFSQHESSDGHNVKGEYEVALPDGRLQIVKYKADWKNGFHADVKYHGESHHPEVYAMHDDSGLDYKGLHRR